MEPGFIPCPADDCKEGYRFQPFRVCEVCGGEGFLEMLFEPAASGMIEEIMKVEEAA